MKWSLENNDALRRFRFAIILILFIIVIGVFGYMLIEGSNFLDAIYMTIITISTVGFKEVHHLSAPGKVFTIILIITSWISFAYAVSLITTYLVGGELNLLFRNYQKKSELKKMENHVIVVGYGRNGRQTVQDLLESRQPFVVIERDHTLVLNNAREDIKFYEGDATEDETMLEVGIKNARALITTLPVDADNLFVILTARSLNPGLYIVSRASNESAVRKMEMAGVNNVIMPEKVGGSHMASLVTKPDLVDFLRHISFKGDHETNLEEIICSELPEDKKTTSINNLNIRSQSGANIIGFKTPEGKYIINPSADTRMVPNSKLFVLGTPDQIEKMKEIIRNCPKDHA